MGTVVRLLLLSHASTEALHTARFPADEPLSEHGRRAAENAAALGATRVLVGPELRTRETAAAIGVDGHVEPELRDLDAGSWRGLTTEEVPEPELLEWLTDPCARPHGGETVAELVERVRGWLQSVAEGGADTLAVTHPALVRAAVLVTLDAPAQSLWRIDVAPMSVTRLHWRNGAWTLRSTGHESPRVTP